MADDISTLTIKRFDPSDPRLGRHVVHDSQSRRYRFKAAQDPRTLTSKRHTILLPILDQGNVGACTGYTGVETLGSERFWPAGKSVLHGDAAADGAYALGLYAEATTYDPWPGQYEPDDTGSDGLSIAKALKERGLISGYEHAFTLADALAALAQGVVMVGTSWRSGMFTPGLDGRLNIKGTEEGGHEYPLDQIDVENERVWMRNHWTEAWGIKGRAWLTWDDFGELLADYGDCTILVPRSEPAPQPQPEPTSAPTPSPAPAADRDLEVALRKIVDNRTCPAYLKAPAAAWLKERA